MSRCGPWHTNKGEMPQDGAARQSSKAVAGMYSQALPCRQWGRRVKQKGWGGTGIGTRIACPIHRPTVPLIVGGWPTGR
jgi:hypothetical protein